MSPDRWPGRWLSRLETRLLDCRGPIVQIWGWPGSGQGRLLRELGRQDGLEVPPAALSDPATLAAAAESARHQGLRYLLCRRWPGEGLREGLDAVPSRPLIVFTSRVLEVSDPDSDEIIGPRELALTVEEIRDLWEASVGEVLSPASAETLRLETDGWSKPLELAMQSATRGWRDSLDAGALAALPEVQDFLEGEVLAPLPPALRDAALGGTVSPKEEAELRHRGLVFSGPSGRLERPSLLKALGELRQVGLGLPTAVPRDEELPSAIDAPSTPHAVVWPVEENDVPADALTFQMQFLGPAQVWCLHGDQRTAITWNLRRSLKIFAYLLSQPDHRASRQSLVEAAFQDESLEAVRRNFHPTLSLLRRSLSQGSDAPLDVLLFREGFYELSSEFHWRVDADAFLGYQDLGLRYRHQGRNEEAAASWKSAWKLYRGPFLEGYEESWVLRRREALDSAYLILLKDLGDALSDLHRLPEALDAYRALLVEDALQEPVQVSVMNLYAAQGRRDLVRRQYDRLSKLLNEELGVEPLQATTLAYHRLMG